MTGFRCVRSLFMRFAPFLGVAALSFMGFFGTAHFAHAAALTSTNVQPASLVAGASGTVTVTFTTATNLPGTGKIKITFGSGFDTSTLGGPVTCTGLDGSIIFGRSGQVVTLTRSGGATTSTAPASISCGLPTITNPTVAGSTGTYTIQTTDTSDVQIDVDAAVTADTITAAALTSTNVQPASLRTSSSTTVTISFTTVNALENDGKISVTFPSGFNVASAAGGTCSTMDGTFATSVASQVVTLTRSGGGSEPAGAQTCTINGILNPSASGAAGTYTISTKNSADATHDTDAAVTSDNFSSSSSSHTSTPLTYSIDVASPAEGDVYEPGDVVGIEWTLDGTGTMSYVNISYSDDAGSTWVSVATNERNDESYMWTVPDISSDEVMVKVEGTDLAIVLATGESDIFAVMAASSDEETVDDGENDTDGENMDDEDSGSSADLLPEGTYVRWESAAAVYYVDSEGYIHPFLDAQTFFTYADDFDDVVDLSADEIAEYSMGSPMLPNPGTVLIKIESVAKVYALVEEDGIAVLRWITSEDLAKEFYGNSWADYVIDVPVTSWSHFEIGDAIESADDISVDISDMLTREEVND